MNFVQFYTGYLSAIAKKIRNLQIFGGLLTTR